MEFDTKVKLAVYNHFAETGHRPSPGEVGERVGSDIANVLDAYRRLRAQRLSVWRPVPDDRLLRPRRTQCQPAVAHEHAP